PAGHCWFSFSHVTTSVDSGVFWVACPVHFHHLITEQVDIPYHQGPRSEVVSTLAGHSCFSSWAIIAFTSHLSGKDWRALQEFHAGRLASIECRVRAERATVWQVNNESYVIA